MEHIFLLIDDPSRMLPAPSPPDQLAPLKTTSWKNYANPAQAVIDILVKVPLASACDRLKIYRGRLLPKNDIELRAEIDSLLKSDLIPEEGKERLKTIRCAVSRCAFGRCIELYARFVERFLSHDRWGHRHPFPRQSSGYKGREH